MGGVSIVPVVREYGVEVFELGLKLWRRVASKLGFVLWGLGSLLFDNRIGRKRDVGGGVLAGLRLPVEFWA